MWKVYDFWINFFKQTIFFSSSFFKKFRMIAVWNTTSFPPMNLNHANLYPKLRSVPRQSHSFSVINLIIGRWAFLCRRVSSGMKADSPAAQERFHMGISIRGRGFEFLPLKCALPYHPLPCSTVRTIYNPITKMCASTPSCTIMYCMYNLSYVPQPTKHTCTYL